MTRRRRYTRTEAPTRSLVPVCALRRTAGSRTQRRQARARGSGGKSTLSHVRLPCGESRAARWRFAATGRQQCDLVSCFKGTFCGEWTVLCIRARCVLTRTTLRFVTLRRRRRLVSIHCVYIHNRRARLSCCPTKVDLPVSRSLLRPFFPLSFPRLCEIISHVLQSEDTSTARFALS